MMDENSPELPNGWVWVKLGEITRKINPGFPSGKYNREGKGIPHLRPMNINTRGEIDFSDVKYVQREGYDSLLEGDVLFNNTNSPELLGKTTYIKKDTNWAYSNHMTRIRLYRAAAHSGWIACCLHYLFLIGYYRMNCIHHVNQASINIRVLSEKIPLPLPPFPEQQRIVTKIEELFTELDAGIDALKKVKTQLKRYRQAVLKYAFEGKLTEEWREMHREELESASVILDRIKEEKKKNAKKRYKELPPIDVSNLPELPDGWIWTRIGEIAEKVTDGTHHTPTYVGHGIPFISVKDVLDGKVHFENCRYISEEEHKSLIRRCNPEYMDVLITKSGTIGRTAVIKTRKPFSLFVSVALIKPCKNYINPDFLAFSLQNYINGIDIQQSIKGGVIKNLHIEDLREINIFLPPILEQQKIVEEIEQRFSVADEIEKTVENTLKQAERLRQSILKKAFEGNLVPQNPDDEPASVLLERIKAEKAKKASKKTRKSKKSEKYEQKRLINNGK